MEEAIKQFAPRIKSMMATQGALSKAFFDKYGKDALPIIAEVMGRTGVERGNAAIKQGVARSMKAVGEQLEMMEKILGVGLKIIDLSDDMVHFEASQCPMGIKGTSRELCEALMATEPAWVGTLLGQEVEMKIPKTVAAGDECCEVILSKK